MMVVHFFFSCPECMPRAQVFLNDWEEHWGLTVLEAESEGYRPKAKRVRILELLAELGVQPAPPQLPYRPAANPWPHPGQHPGQRPKAYIPLKKKPKPGKK